MSRQKDIYAFYNKKGIADTSRKGYYQEKVDFFCNHLESISPQSKILDIACNDGELTKLYTKYGDVLGIDINEAAIRECKKKQLHCIVSTLEDLPRQYNAYFDVIIAGDIIEHIFNTDDFLQSIYKRLKKGGFLLLTTPNLVSFGRRIMMLLGKNPYIEFSTKLPYEEFNVGHVRYYTHDDLSNQLLHNHFRNIQIEGDKINLTNIVSFPYTLAKFLPKLSRNLMTKCTK